MSDVRIEEGRLQEFATRIFTALGMPDADAALEAEVLVWSNMRGVDSHGVQLVEAYIDWVDKGYVRPRPNVRIEKETPAILLMEADHAFGPVVTVPAMNKAIAKARDVGIGWSLIRNTRHQGCMAYYTHLAAAQGMVGIAVVTSCPANMAPPGAKTGGTHNSPIAIAAPGRNRVPISLDMATSVVAQGKIGVALDKGLAIPDDWALDEDGNVTTDPAKAEFVRPAAGYKGYGLALLFECMSSLMSGNPLLTTWLRGGDVGWGTQNSFVAAIDIATFTDLDAFRDDVDLLAETMAGLPTHEGAGPLKVPGDLEQEAFEERSARGIPLPAGTVAKLQAAAARFGLDLPSELA